MKLLNESENMVNVPWSKRFRVENDEVVIGVHKDNNTRKYRVTGYYKSNTELIPSKAFLDIKQLNKYANKFGINFTNLPN